jgi:hypothetical protein
MFATQNHSNLAESLSQTGTVIGKHVAGEIIKTPQKGSGLEIQILISLLEFVEFFENRDGDGNVVFFKTPQAPGVVKNYIRIKNE